MELCIGGKTSKFSTLKNAIFKDYKSDAKPDGKIDVQSGLMVTDFNLCPKKEIMGASSYDHNLYSNLLVIKESLLCRFKQ